MSQVRIPDRRAAFSTAALVAAILLGSIVIAGAQEVVAVVDGVPITALDVQERTKLMKMSSPKPPARQEVIDSLIDEILEIHEAKDYGIEVPDSEVDKAYANVGQKMGADADKLTQMLKAGGASEATLKNRLRAQLAWDALIRGRYKASLEVPDSDVEAELKLHNTDAKDNVGYEYTMRPIVFIVPTGAPDAAYEARKREADSLRARFDDCADGIPFARALSAVAVRDQVIKFSADLPQQSRQILDSTQVGHLTPPERTAEGVQTFAICGKRQTKSDSPEKVELRNEIFQNKFGLKAKLYLEKLRRAALIEYK